MTDFRVGRADERITALGITVTLLRKARSFDPATGQTSTSTGDDTAIIAKAVVVDYQSRYIDGSIIRRGDRKFILTGLNLGMTPVAGDHIVQGSQTFNVVNVETKHIGENVAAFECQVRK